VFNSRADYIAKTVGHKLVVAFEKDRTRPVSLKRSFAKERKKLSEETQDNIVKLALLILKELQKADPTKNHQYLQWITKQYINESFRIEDIEIIKSELESFEKYKPRLRSENKETDINKYMLPGEVFSLLQAYREKDITASKKEELRNKEARFFATEQAVLFYRDDKLKIIIPHTEEASCFFGKGTRWCTAATIHNNHFTSYSIRGLLYIIMTPTGKFQFHFETNSFMNELDEPVKIEEVVKLYPSLKDAFDEVASKCGFIPLVKHVTPQLLYKTLMQITYEQCGGMLTMTSVLESVDPSAQDERIAALVVGHSPSYAIKIIRPDLQATTAFQHALIQKRPALLQAINPEIQTAELVEKVVLTTPTMLRYVRPDLMTEKLLIKVVGISPLILGQIPLEKQSVKVITAALKNSDSKRPIINMVKDKKLKSQLLDALDKHTLKLRNPQ
jgi:hypothetical protein